MPSLPWLHGGDLVAQQLKAFGTEYVFTLTGGHISPLYDGLRFVDVPLIDFRHEQAAVHAADAYARVRRDVAVAAVTAGPGVTGAVTGVANAYYAESPVIVLGGRNPFITDGAGNLQEAPHLELMRPITKYCTAAYDCWRSRDVLHDAFATAQTPRLGPAFLDLPMDMQLTRVPLDAAPPVRTRPRRAVGGVDPDAMREVAARLGTAAQPVVLVGSGAYWARAEQSLHAFACGLKAPVFANGMARGILGAHHPFQVVSGRREALRGADVVLMLGVDFDFRLGFGQPGVIHPGAFVVQVDPDASRLGRNRDVDMGIASDIERFLTELVGLDSAYGRPTPPRWTANLLANDAARRERRAHGAGTPGTVHPVDFTTQVADFLDEDATVIGDGGDIVAMFASRHRPGGPGLWMDPGPFGCLGVGAPFAIGARLHRRDTQVAVIFGDGSFGFNAFEFESAIRQDLPFVGVIGNDGAWGEMRTFHADLFGEGDMSAQYLSQDPAYEQVVEALGGHGERVDRAEDIKPALERAFAAGVPAVVNVILDPTYRRENAAVSGKHVARSYGEGDPNAFKRP
jgi:acetolactate synthase-1/2/3 large subunit